MRLTNEQWQATPAPFHWMRVRTNLSDIEITFVEKWLEANTQGWWYFDKADKDHYLYVFENEAEMVQFKIWLSDRPFDNEHGDIDEKQVL